jgi:hypothetical protein
MDRLVRGEVHGTVGQILLVQKIEHTDSNADQRSMSVSYNLQFIRIKQLTDEITHSNYRH